MAAMRTAVVLCSLQCAAALQAPTTTRRMNAASGTPTTLTIFRDMPHVSPIFSFCHETPRTALRQAGAFVRACLGTKRRRGVLVDVVSARGLRRGLFAKAPRVGVALLKDGRRGEFVWTDRAVAGEMETYAFGRRGTRGNVVVELEDALVGRAHVVQSVRTARVGRAPEVGHHDDAARRQRQSKG